MKKENELTPSSNTGSMDTSLPPLRSLIDWVSISFFENKTFLDLVAILRLDPADFTFREKGYKGYKESAEFGHIIVAWNSPDHTVNMGGFIELSGQGCREYELHFDMNLNWSEFFASFMTEKYRFTRLDIAIDDFKGYFTIDQLYRCAKKGAMTAKRITKARTYEEFFIEDGKTHSRTFYVGKSDWVLRFYNKLVERQNYGVELPPEITFWNRYEVQLRGDLATQAAQIIAYEAYDLGDFAKGFMASKIDFKIKNKTDSNKARWQSQKWWLDFLDDCKKLELTQVAPDPSIEKIGHWLEHQVARSAATYLKAYNDDEEVLKKLIQIGRKKMGKKEYQLINKFKTISSKN